MPAPSDSSTRDSIPRSFDHDVVVSTRSHLDERAATRHACSLPRLFVPQRASRRSERQGATARGDIFDEDPFDLLFAAAGLAAAFFDEGAAFAAFIGFGAAFGAVFAFAFGAGFAVTFAFAFAVTFAFATTLPFAAFAGAAFAAPFLDVALAAGAGLPLAAFAFAWTPLAGFAGAAFFAATFAFAATFFAGAAFALDAAFFAAGFAAGFAAALPVAAFAFGVALVVFLFEGGESFVVGRFSATRFVGVPLTASSASSASS